MRLTTFGKAYEFIRPRLTRVFLVSGISDYSWRAAKRGGFGPIETLLGAMGTPDTEFRRSMRTVTEYPAEEDQIIERITN